MTSRSPLPPGLQELADALAEEKISAALSAMTVVSAEIINLMVRKNVVTRDEVMQRLTIIEALSRSSAATTPLTSGYTLRLTMELRNAFDDTKRKQS